MRIRTGYSFRTAIGHIPEALDRIKEIGWKVAPISDRCSTFGFVKWTKACAERKLRPIYGVEIGVTASLGERRPVLDYWTFFAKGNIRALHDLIWLATSNPGKEPSLLYEEALAAEGVIKIAGERCLTDCIPKGTHKDFYVALSPSTPTGLLKRAKARKLKMIASGDNKYPVAGDFELYRVMLWIKAGSQTYPQHILSNDEWSEAVPGSAADKKAARSHLAGAIKKCTAVLQRASLLVPDKPLSLREMCVQGADKKGCDISDPVYAARLDKELGLIEEKKYEDYFYIITECISWAKARMVVGPARGSSGGSLVCYLLDITAIDPIPYGLIFERFIDTNRDDLPDIDIDFSDQKRHLVFEHLEQLYGEERVARLGTVGTFRARSALNQAGKSLKVPIWKIAKLTDSIIVRSSADARAMLALQDTLENTDAGKDLLGEYPELILAGRLEGHPNVSSQHAAGVVVTQDPIKDFVAVDYNTKAAWCEKKDAEHLNLLKIDALGLTQLSIFERTLELIGEEPISGWLEKLPTTDQRAYDVLNAGHYAGIFQFNGMALRSLADQVTVDCFDDIVALTALARPGPLATGGANDWVKRKKGEEFEAAAHPLLDELTEDTFGTVVFQETVMNIVRQIGKMSWQDTSSIRRGMSGSLGDEFFAQYRVRFIDGAVETGLTEEAAKEVWEQVNTFGSWAFNKSHAVAYGLVSYWCCWLKAYHPVEFAAATLDSETEVDRQLGMLRELDEEGIHYTPVDADHSTDKWSVVREGNVTRLVGPLSNIKGIGPAKLRAVLDARSSEQELSPALAKQIKNAKTPIDSLWPIKDKVRSFDLDKLNVVTEPTPVAEVQTNGQRQQVTIFAIVKRVAPRDENDPANVQKRGGKVLSGPTQAINLFFADDTGEIFCKIDRFKYGKLGAAFLEKARAGKSIFAIRGEVPDDFRMIRVSLFRYLGEIDD
jgi:DNA-directed DNA polymerase III PolC